MEMDVRALNALIPVFDFVGIVAFALSGVFEGIKRRIDPVGVFIVAFSTAFGGGMLRDILIDRRPFYWIDHEAYVVATFIICMAAPFIYKFFQKTKHAHDWYIFADAIGLGIFCISGTSLSLAAGVPWLSSVIIGCITGVFGGLMRDCFLNQMPAVVADRQPYAVVGFIGCWFYIMLLELKVPVDAALWAGFISLPLSVWLACRLSGRFLTSSKKTKKKPLKINNLSGLHQQAIFFELKKIPRCF